MESALRLDLQRLELLTLAAEEAVRNGAWDDLACLIAERESVLDTLETCPPSDLELQILQRAMNADARFTQALADARTETIDALARTQSGRKLAAVYAPDDRLPYTDQTG